MCVGQGAGSSGVASSSLHPSSPRPTHRVHLNVHCQVTGRHGLHLRVVEAQPVVLEREGGSGASSHGDAFVPRLHGPNDTHRFHACISAGKDNGGGAGDHNDDGHEGGCEARGGRQRSDEVGATWAGQAGA